MTKCMYRVGQKVSLITTAITLSSDNQLLEVCQDIFGHFGYVHSVATFFSH